MAGEGLEAQRFVSFSSRDSMARWLMPETHVDSFSTLVAMVEE